MPQGPNFIVTFLYYFSTTILIVLLVMSQGMGVELNSGTPYQTGVLLGAIAGILGAYFNRSTTISVNFHNQTVFTKTLEQALDDMGFSERENLGEVTLYTKSNLKNLFSGKILVKIEGNLATISGRSNALKQLQQML